MRISNNGPEWLTVKFGTAYTAKVLNDARAIIDFSQGNLPAQIELVSVVDWASRFCNQTIAIPTPRDLGEDAWCLRYDPSVDCLMVYLSQDSRTLAPFRNREVSATLWIDSSGRLCGVSVRLESVEVSQALQRTNQ